MFNKDTNFTKMYLRMNQEILDNGSNLDSRVGKTKEVLAHTMTIINPEEMCVGGHLRKLNIFFLLAESMWIWAGQRDVEFLQFFNSGMSQFSDDGKSFAAPYGFRLRHWGKYSFENEALLSSIHLLNGEDQILAVLQLLQKTPETRRAVCSIWNPDFDLGVNSKDIPCNDTLFFKIRENKLHLTIANRSNDLHWGLPTNVFQFGFILRSMAKILGVGVGHQNHLSDSLHIYTDREDSDRMIKQSIFPKDFNLYDHCVPASFGDQKISVDEYDRHVNRIIMSLRKNVKNDFSGVKIKIDTGIPFLDGAYKMLKIYSWYKYKKKSNGDLDKKRVSCIEELLGIEELWNTDLLLLGVNFFMKNLDSNTKTNAKKMISEKEVKMVSPSIIEFLGDL